MTDGARVLSHTISFWLTAILLSAMLAATAYGTRARAQLQSSRIGVYGPLCLMAVAALLVIADPLRRVLQNGGVWTDPSSSAFRDGCGEGWKCLTTTGILFMAVSRAAHNLTTLTRVVTVATQVADSRHLSVASHFLCSFVQQVFTYTGFAALFTASLWSGNLLALCRDRLCARQSQDTRQAHAAEEFAAANAIREEEERIEEAARIEAVAQAHIETQPKQKVMLASVFPASAKPFANLHVDMKPPPANTFVFSAEDCNGLGNKKNIAFSLVTNNVTALRRGPWGELLSPPRAATGHSTSVTRAADFAPEGYSYDTDSSAVVESVIKVAPLPSSYTGGLSSGSSKPLSARERAAHDFGVHPHVPSPIVTSTPSIMSPGAAFAASSPLSSFCNVALTPANGAGGGAANSAASPSSHAVCPPVSAVEKRFQPQAHHARRPTPLLV